MDKSTNAPGAVFINAGLHGGRLLKFDTLPSTNQWALDNISTLGHGDIVWALSQTAGKGRFDRQWISPGNLSLTVSIILTPPPSGELFISAISQIAALAVATTLEKESIQAMLKWPNDVLVNGRKIAGILAERDSETGRLVLGIGLNVNMTKADFQNAKLIFPATSMRIESARNYDMREILDLVIVELDKTIRLISGPDPAFPRSQWQRRDFLKGRHINIQTTETMLAGTYSGIDGSGRLLLADEAGRQKAFWSGDVSLGSGNYTA